MKKFPWKTLMLGSAVMMLLVLARCIATVARELYYGRQAWMNVVLQDRWFYVGVAAVVVFYISAIVCIVRNRKA